MANGRPVTNDNLYQALNDMRLELKGDITRLETKLDNLQDGKLASIEAEVTRLKVSAATASTKLAVIGFISASVIGALISAIAPRLL